MVKWFFRILVSFNFAGAVAPASEFERWEVDSLIRNGARTRCELGRRGPISRSLLERTRKLAREATPAALPDWIRLVNEPYAYPELRALALQAVSRIRALLNVSAGPLPTELAWIDGMGPERPRAACTEFVERLSRARDPLLATAILQAMPKPCRHAAAGRILELYDDRALPLFRMAAAESLADLSVYVPHLCLALAERAAGTEAVPELHAIARGIANQCRLGLALADRPR